MMLRVPVCGLAWLAPFAAPLVLSGAVLAADPASDTGNQATPSAAAPAPDTAPQASPDAAKAAAPEAAAPAAPESGGTPPTKPEVHHAAKPALPKKTVDIVYLGKAYPEPIPLSLMDPILTDKGMQGARLGIDDNNVTGELSRRRDRARGAYRSRRRRRRRRGEEGAGLPATS